MLREWREEQRYQKYELQLLTRKIGMWEVPESLRRDRELSRGIYIMGFRADRMVSKERYETDLRKLEVEIALIEAEDRWRSCWSSTSGRIKRNWRTMRR